MQTLLILYLLFAFVCSIAIGYFQYFYKVKRKFRGRLLLCVLKITAFFLVFVLLISPKIERTTLQIIKPKLSILVDNSKSISYFREAKNIQNFIYKLKNDLSLSEKFEIENFTFSADLKISDSLDFLGSETNIHKAISGIHKLNGEQKVPILLLTDGNQTVGNAYEFLKSKQPIYPVVFGDTTKYADVKVSQINVNTYSYLKNKFPVEVFLNYQGIGTVKSIFSIYNGEKTVFSKEIQFSRKERSQILTVDLEASKIGVNSFTASLEKIRNEKNIKNNTRNFSVEVIDEQAKVLLLSAVLHPDIGLLKKAIESNVQRSVKVSKVTEFKGNLSEFQLVILYQPNVLFSDVFTKIKKAQCNLFIVTGTNTDWALLNKQQFGFTKNFLRETEYYGASYHTSFSTFLQKDIGFGDFPPLKDAYGALDFSTEHQDLLVQEIKGLVTMQPLLSVLEKEKQKIAVIFGAGIWRWRATSFLRNDTFQDFDQFIGNIVQYLGTKKPRAQLEVNTERLYASNAVLNIVAFFTDTNYKFDDRASLEITVTNIKTKETTTRPFSVKNNSYQSAIEGLSPGEYRYKVAVLGQKNTAYGNFKIVDDQIEEQFTHANVTNLTQLALGAGGALYYKNEIDLLIKSLMENNEFDAIQKPIVKTQELIDWQWVLLVLISLFTTEWFLRKYFGQI